MKAASIRYSNLDIIIDGLNQSFESRKKDNQIIFKNKISGILSMVDLSITFDNVSTLELFFLNKLATNIIPLSSQTVNPIKSNELRDIAKDIDALISVSREISCDEDIKNHNSHNLILPIGTTVGSVRAHFTGNSLLNIFGYVMENMFPRNSDGYFFIDKDTINDTLLEKFFNAFYGIMISNLLTSRDILSDYLFDKKYYVFSNNNSVSELSSINHTAGSIKFLRQQPEDLQRSLALFNEYKHEYCDSDMSITIILNTSFSTFIDINLVCKEYVIDHENFDVVYARNVMVADKEIFSKYKYRISEPINHILLNKKLVLQPANAKAKANEVIHANEKLKQTEDVQNMASLKIYNYIFHGSMIKYVMKIPCDKIEYLISQLNQASYDYPQLYSNLKKYIQLIKQLKE